MVPKARNDHWNVYFAERRVEALRLTRQGGILATRFVVDAYQAIGLAFLWNMLRSSKYLRRSQKDSRGNGLSALFTG